MSFQRQQGSLKFICLMFFLSCHFGELFAEVSKGKRTWKKSCLDNFLHSWCQHFLQHLRKSEKKISCSPQAERIYKTWLMFTRWSFGIHMFLLLIIANTSTRVNSLRGFVATLVTFSLLASTFPLQRLLKNTNKQKKCFPVLRIASTTARFVQPFRKWLLSVSSLTV